MRAKELSALLEHVKRGESVRLVSNREFGRTMLLGELQQALDAQGFNVSRVAGEESLVDSRYGALRQSFLAPERLSPNLTPSEVSVMIAAELSQAPNAVVLVDDAEWLDRYTAEVLTSLLDSPNVCGVFVTLPFRNLTAEERAIAHMLRADARIDLPALSFEQVGVLSQRVLGPNVSPEIVSEVFSMSSGIAGIAAQILRTARASKGIVRGAERWEFGGRMLWNADLEETVERMLAPLDDASLKMLHALSLVGDAPAEAFESADPASAVTLTRQGLVTVFREPHGDSRVAPRPALVADYSRHRPIDLLHVSALELIEQVVDPAAKQPRRADIAELMLDMHSRHSDTEEAHNAGLARFLRERTARQLNVAGREWRRNRRPSTALTYLDALLPSGSYLAPAEEVLERTSPDGATGRELVQLALHERFVRQNGRSQTTEYAKTLRRDFPDHAPALVAFDILAEFNAYGRTEKVESWLAALPSDPLWLGKNVAVFIRATSGETPSETELVVPPQGLAMQRVITEQSRMVMLARRASSTDTVEALLDDTITLGPGDDPVPFIVSTYVRSQLLLGLGKVTEARELLSQALSVGDLDIRYGTLYAAMLRWSAFLHMRDGRVDIAQALISESHAYDAFRGPMPGMRPEFGAALEVLFTGDRERAGQEFLTEARECLTRSFFDAAWSTARCAFQLYPVDESLEVLSRVVAHESYGWARPVVDFARAALDQDPNLVAYIGPLSGLPELVTAADFLEDIEFWHVNKGVEYDPEFARAVAEAHQSFVMYREPLSHVIARERPSGLGNLTPREREIAALSATLTNREIAERLTLSVRTVENHIARSMKKLGLGSRASLSSAVAEYVRKMDGHRAQPDPEAE